MNTNSEQPKSFSSFYIARQPILDRAGSLWGYELLFRDQDAACSAIILDEDVATTLVATSGFTFAQRKATVGERICINFTDALILEGAPKALPPTITVVELLETSKLSEDLFYALIELKQDGYLIAIDDYLGDPLFDRFIEIADIIKVDVLGMSKSKILEISSFLANKRAILLAEKVETQEEYNFLLECGFSLFQGYYFAKPEIFSGKRITSAQQVHVSALAKINQEGFSIEDCLFILKSDVALTFRLLRFLNSPAFCFSMEIKSIQQAVALLGIKRIKQWLRLVIMSDLNSKPVSTELCVMALARAVFFEELEKQGAISGHSADEMFLFGMFSMLDAMLEMPMVEVLELIPIPQTLKDGFLSESSSLQNLLKIVANLENGDWDEVDRLAQNGSLPAQVINSAYSKGLSKSLYFRCEQHL